MLIGDGEKRGTIVRTGFPRPNPNATITIPALERSGARTAHLVAEGGKREREGRGAQIAVHPTGK